MAYIWMLLSALSFATMGALAHALRDEVSWQVTAFTRSVVVLGLSVALVWSAGVTVRIWRPWQLWARSIAGSVSMLFVFFSLARMPISIVVTLMNLAPAWVAIAAWFLWPETRSKSVWVAIAVGIIGVGLIQQPQLAQGNQAVLAPLVASFLLAIVMMALHQTKAVDSRAVVLHFAATAFVTSFCVFLYAELTSGVVFAVNKTTIAMLVATGVAATLGQIFLTLAFASGAPAKVSVVGLTQVGMAMFYDVIVYGHQFNLLSVFGILCIVAPTAWLLYVERQEWVEE